MAQPERIKESQKSAIQAMATAAFALTLQNFKMAQVFDNVLISGLRGRIGKQLMFRVVNGVTIVSRAPGKPDRKKETEAQRKTRVTFRAASRWAKAQLACPERKGYYTKLAKTWNLTNAYTAAVKDYMLNATQPRAIERTQRSRQGAITGYTESRSQRQTLLPGRLSLIMDNMSRIADMPAVESPLRSAPDSALAAFRNYLDVNGSPRYTRHRRQHEQHKNETTRGRPSTIVFEEIP